MAGLEVGRALVVVLLDQFPALDGVARGHVPGAAVVPLRLAAGLGDESAGAARVHLDRDGRCVLPGLRQHHHSESQRRDQDPAGRARRRAGNPVCRAQRLCQRHGCADVSSVVRPREPLLYLGDYLQLPRLRGRLHLRRQHARPAPPDPAGHRHRRRRHRRDLPVLRLRHRRGRTDERDQRGLRAHRRRVPHDGAGRGRSRRGRGAAVSHHALRQHDLVVDGRQLHGGLRG